MKRIRIRHLLSIIMVFILFGSICVSAEERLVINEEQLKQAIENADDGDVIVVQNDITITELINEIEIVKKSITIKSREPACTITQSFGRHFEVSDGAVLTLENIILDGEGSKGGIDASNSEIIISDGATIQNCRAINGGGIFAINSNVTLENGGKVNYNIAEWLGGGIYIVDEELSGDITLAIAGEVNGNVNNHSDGGGIYAGNIEVRVENSGQVSNNSTFDRGGGIWADSKVIIYGTMSGNTANLGGGIFAEAIAEVNIDGGYIFNNNAHEQGGGIYLTKDTSLVATNNTSFVKNLDGTQYGEYLGSGGAIFTEGIAISYESGLSRSENCESFNAFSVIDKAELNRNYYIPYSNLDIDHTVEFVENEASYYFSTEV